MSLALQNITQFFPISDAPCHSGISSPEHLGTQAPQIPLAWSIDLEIRLLYTEALRMDESSQVRPAQVEDWCQRAHECLVSTARNAPSLLTAWRAALSPFFMKSHFLNRCRTKPRGYAGDYLSIQMMYDLVPSGEGMIGRSVDSWALNQPCPRAVRNRRFLIENLVHDLRKTFATETLSVVSLGSGPAAEVFDCDTPNTRFTLVDIDEEALGYVQRKIDLNRMSARVNTVLGNVIKIVLGRASAIPSEQHAFYSLGLIDYFKDDLVVRLLDYIYANLKQGGIAYLGNFTPDHPNADFFQHVLDWPLVLRSKDELLQLVQRSQFRGSPVTLGSEGEGIQLFIKAIKT